MFLLTSRLDFATVVRVTSPDESGHIRIGDDEREQAIRALGDHYSRGRIDLREYEQRLTRATSARSADDLCVLFSDLPGPHPAFGSPTPFTPPMPSPAGTVAPSTNPLLHSEKSKTAAGLLQIFLPFGIGRFYTGHTGLAVGQLVAFLVGLLLCGIGAIPAVVWCVVDGIVILASDSTDEQGRLLRD